MKSGNKNFEIRLNDEKRQHIKVGDTIVFTKRPEPNDQFRVKVTSLDAYKDFAGLWEGVKDNYPNHNKDSFIKAMYEYYPPEEEKQYGALVINFDLI